MGEAIARKTRIIDVVYNACNNELVRTKTLVKNAIVTIDAAPFRQWFEAHYALPLGRKKGAKLPDADEAVSSKRGARGRGQVYREEEGRQGRAGPRGGIHDRSSPGLNFFPTGPVRTCRRLHPRGQRARVLPS